MLALPAGSPSFPGKLTRPHLEGGFARPAASGPQPACGCLPSSSWASLPSASHPVTGRAPGLRDGKQELGSGRWTQRGGGGLPSRPLERPGLGCVTPPNPSASSLCFSPSPSLGTGVWVAPPGHLHQPHGEGPRGRTGWGVGQLHKPTALPGAPPAWKLDC